MQNEIRRANLKALVTSWKVKQESKRESSDMQIIAAHLGISPSHLSQLLSGHRGIGNNIAPKIEKNAYKNLKMKPGWLDRVESDLSPEALYLAREYDKLPEAGKAEMLGYLNFIHHKLENPPTKGTIDTPTGFYIPTEK